MPHFMGTNDGVVYNGEHFKTEQAARWALFFDTLGIQYEYFSREPSQGFYLAQQSLLAIIQEQKPLEEELRWIQERASAQKIACVFLYGSIGPGEYTIMGALGDDVIEEFDRFAVCLRCGGLWLFVINTITSPKRSFEERT